MRVDRVRLLFEPLSSDILGSAFRLYWLTDVDVRSRFRPDLLTLYRTELRVLVELVYYVLLILG